VKCIVSLHSDPAAFSAVTASDDVCITGLAWTGYSGLLWRATAASAPALEVFVKLGVAATSAARQAWHLDESQGR